MNGNQHKPRRKWWRLFFTMTAEAELVVFLSSVSLAYALDVFLYNLGFIRYAITVHAYIWTVVPVYVVFWGIARYLSYRKRGW